MPLADTSSVQPNPLIAPGDGMLFEDRREEYFSIGRRALELIQFSGSLCDKPHYPRILDLPCGHGRVLRWLQSRPNLILRAYMEQAWGIQDVVILYKKAGYFEPLPARAFP